MFQHTVKPTRNYSQKEHKIMNRLKTMIESNTYKTQQKSLKANYKYSHKRKNLFTYRLKYIYDIQFGEGKNEKNTTGSTLNIYLYVLTHIQLSEEERRKKKQ